MSQWVQRADLRRVGPALCAALVLALASLPGLATGPLAPAQASAPWVIEVNSATQAELEMVTGIGPDLSSRLLAQRQERPFRDWADLVKRVKGLGQVRAGQLSAEGLRVQGMPFAPHGAQPPASATRP